MRPADWGDTAAAFASYLLTTGKSRETVRTYSSAVAILWRWCEEREECAIAADKTLLRAWLGARAALVSSTRVHSNLAGLHCFYEFLIDAGLRDDDPSKGLRIKRTETLPTEPLSLAEIQQLLRACDNERDILIVLLLAFSGVRITEFASMEAEDIDWEKGAIIIRHGKGDVARRVTPSAEIMARLHSYVGFFHTGPLWLSQRQRQPMSAHQIRKVLYAMADRAGLPHVHPHRFRSTFACEFIEQFGDIHALKGAMGHKSIDTTARYAKAVEMRRGQAMMKRLALPLVG